MSVTINGDSGITSSGDITLNSGTADGAQVVLASSGYSNWNLDNYSGNFRAYYNATEYFRIDNSGNVLIGTTAQSTGCKLTVNGSIKGTITSGTAVASTSGTSIDFTSIPSWVKRITVMFSGVSTNGTSIILAQLGDSGGIENTGYTSIATQTTNLTVASATATAGYALNMASVAASALSGLATITNVSGNVWVYQAGFGYTDRTNAAGGTKTLSDTLTQIRITTVNGTDTFDAGSINILYEG